MATTSGVCPISSAGSSCTRRLGPRLQPAPVPDAQGDVSRPARPFEGRRRRHGGPHRRSHVPRDTYNSFEEYFTTFQRFTGWGAQDLFEQGKRAGLFDLTVRPWTRFVKMYVLRQGFRDGLHGAVLCGLAAFSVFAKYAKLWNLARLERGGDGPPPSPHAS